ncbi:Transcription regulator, TetR family protein [Lactiplantibacillus plantarum]|uniref:dihydroxyacetone kinase transcriptional activator DhaS n=1 Tax=Lactiplantibacillus plantarum TaxID=1590 RepID=UPI00083F7EEE|nr:dihydroxyacetone kinase transcriptional activator DhaS [Lactiplantibacillus plantarum]AOG32567.1 Transcription regulator, TetR family protein [Lactiplantibacillus plantarum]
MAYITKKKIAQAFHDVVLVRGFSRTSVTAIMSTADFRRQTFYDCFQDKYELLTWFIDDTLTETVEHNLNYLPWIDIIKLVCYELDANRQFYAECINTQHEIDVTALVGNHLATLLTELTHANTTETSALIWLLCLGIAQSLTHNIVANHPEDYEVLSQHAIAAIEMTLEILN